MSADRPTAKQPKIVGRRGRLLGPGRRWRLAVPGLLVVHVALALGSVRDMSTSCDEIAHLTAGYTKWRTGDFRMVPEHPPLAHLWSAIPLLFMDVKLPSLSLPSWWRSDQWGFGAAWFYEVGNDPQRLLFAGRSMIVLLSAALGLTVFIWSRRLFGSAGGLVSLGLYVFCPTMLANGSVVTTDMAAGLFFTLATMTAWSALHRISVGTVIGSGAALGGLFLAKMSAVLIVPVYLLMLAARIVSAATLPVQIGRRRELRSRLSRLVAHLAVAGVQCLVIVAVVWIGHGLRYAAMRDAVAGRDRLPMLVPTAPPEIDDWGHLLERPGLAGEVIALFRRARLLPEAYLYGFTYAFNMTRGRSAFLDGDRSVRGFYRFFPCSFLYKSTLPSLAVLAIAVVGMVRRSPRPARAAAGAAEKPSGLYEWIPLLALLAVYGTTAICSSFNIGHRHILPVYPPLYVLAGAAAWGWKALGRAIRAGVIGLVLLHAAACMSAFPYYLAYFNWIAGGPSRGHRHLVDSSLDWGQDLLRLSRWLKANKLLAAGKDKDGGASALYLSYMGTGSPEYYGIRARPLPTFPEIRHDEVPGPLTPGVYCISATNLQMVQILPASRWTRKQEELYQRCLGRIRSMQQANTDAPDRPWQKGSGTAEARILESENRVRPGDRPLMPRAPEEAESSGIPDYTVACLRFGRLCAALRQREPDAHAGHSILVYHLSQADIDAALFGPPPELAEDDAETLAEMGHLFAESGAPALAEEHYRLALRLRPDDAEIHHNLGVVLGHQGRREEEIAELREAVRLRPGFAVARENLGNALTVTGRSEEAIAQYKEAIRLGPRKPEPYASLGDVYATLGRPDLARPYYEKLVELRPRWAEARASLADSLAGVHEFDLAIAQYQEALRLRPDWPAMHNKLGIALARRGRLAEAAMSFAEALRLQPGVASVHLNLANALLGMERHEDAGRQFEEALRLEPGLRPAEEGLRAARERRLGTAP